MKYKPTSLYYRLKPNHLEYLLSTEPSFPHTIGNVLKELREEEYWTNLSYECVCNLVTYLGLPSHSPSTISDIFIEETTK